MVNSSIIGDAFGGAGAIAKVLGFKNSTEMAKTVNHQNPIIAKHFGDIQKLMAGFVPEGAINTATLAEHQGNKMLQVA